MTRLSAGLICLLMMACGNRPSLNSAPETSEKNRNKDEVVLTAEQQSSAGIEVVTAELSSVPEILRAKGRIALDEGRIWKIGVRTVGSVVAVYAGLGEFVHKGQILARYHADEVRDSRAQYRFELAEVDRLKAAATQARRNLERAEKLLELRAGSVQQVEMMRQDLVTADAAVKKAEIEADRGRDLLEDDLKVPANPAPGADEMEDNVPILAPGDGYVIEKDVTPGKTVDLTSVTFVVGDLSRVWMLASVHQEDLAKLRLNQAASVVLPGDETRRYRGRIANLGQRFDPETRMMEVRIELENPGGALRPEMLVDAEIPVGAAKPALLLPSDAVQQVNGQDSVFVRVSPDHFRVRPVRVGEARDGKAPVLEGVAPGDAVVVRGSFALKSQLLKSSLEDE